MGTDRMHHNHIFGESDTIGYVKLKDSQSGISSVFKDVLNEKLKLYIYADSYPAISHNLPFEDVTERLLDKEKLIATIDFGSQLRDYLLPDHGLFFMIDGFPFVTINKDEIHATFPVYGLRVHKNLTGIYEITNTDNFELEDFMRDFLTKGGNDFESQEFLITKVLDKELLYEFSNGVRSVYKKITNAPVNYYGSLDDIWIGENAAAKRRVKNTVPKEAYSDIQKKYNIKNGEKAKSLMLLLNFAETEGLIEIKNKHKAKDSWELIYAGTSSVYKTWERHFKKEQKGKDGQ